MWSHFQQWNIQNSERILINTPKQPSSTFWTCLLLFSFHIFGQFIQHLNLLSCNLLKLSKICSKTHICSHHKLLVWQRGWTQLTGSNQRSQVTKSEPPPGRRTTTKWLLMRSTAICTAQHDLKKTLIYQQFEVTCRQWIFCILPWAPSSSVWRQGLISAAH